MEEPVMFEAIVSKITSVVRAIGTATRRTPWLAPIAILALFLMW
jgi:hypothetical protein